MGPNLPALTRWGYGLAPKRKLALIPPLSHRETNIQSHCQDLNQVGEAQAWMASQGDEAAIPRRRRNWFRPAGKVGFTGGRLEVRLLALPNPPLSGWGCSPECNGRSTRTSSTGLVADAGPIGSRGDCYHCYNRRLATPQYPASRYMRLLPSYRVGSVRRRLDNACQAL